MVIRLGITDDTAAISAIQVSSPQSAQWRPDDYLQLINDPLGLVLVAAVDDASSAAISGFVAFHRVLDEAELRNLAVDPMKQRRGIGRLLMEQGISILNTRGVRRIFLEVRETNHPAVSLYQSIGFCPVYKRRHYYHDPIEDALVMELRIVGS